MVTENIAAEVEGHEDVLHQLRTGLSESRISIVRHDDGRWYLTGPELDSAGDSSEACEIATAVVTTLNATLRMSRKPPIKFGDRIKQVHEDGSATAKVFLGGTIGVASSAQATLSGGTPEPPTTSLAALAVEANDPTMRHALEILANEPHDFVHLYKVYELMESGGGIAKLGSKKQRGRFTHTADNPDASGRLSRHATTKNRPPSNPMTLDEARSFIYRMMASWIQGK